MKVIYRNLILLVSLSIAIVVMACASDDAADGIEQNPDAEEVVPGTNHKILVAYFTMPERDGVDASTGASRLVMNDTLYGHMEYVAGIIADETGADRFQIKTVKTYPASHQPLIEEAQEEQNNNARPALSTQIENFDDYDVIFIGYPIWWSNMPQAMYTFFDTYDFKGKTIIPFTVHGGSGWAGTTSTIACMEPEATMIRGYSISRNNVAGAREGVINWVRGLNLTTNTENE